MIDYLPISLIQADLKWESPPTNAAMFAEKITALNTPGGLIVLPETFTTGFSMNAEKLAEDRDGIALDWMSSQARLSGATICGSLIFKENGKYYNRMIWMRPDGTYEHYDKHHLFSMAEEDQHFTAGNKRLIVEHQGWKFCPLICYDLRFPVWSRNRFKDGKWDYDCLIYAANWPAKRASAWRDLLKARAHENQCYVIGINRVGKDKMKIDYTGDSMVIGPKGEVLADLGDGVKTETLQLDANALNDFRKDFPIGYDADEFQLTNKVLAQF